MASEVSPRRYDETSYQQACREVNEELFYQINNWQNCAWISIIATSILLGFLLTNHVNNEIGGGLCIGLGALSIISALRILKLSFSHPDYVANEPIIFSLMGAAIITVGILGLNGIETLTAQQMGWGLLGITSIGALCFFVSTNIMTMQMKKKKIEEEAAAIYRNSQSPGTPSNQD